jgi:hypothetical protein
VEYYLELHLCLWGMEFQLGKLARGMSFGLNWVKLFLWGRF